MHTNTQEYKGFTIEIVSYDGIGTISFRFFVKAPGFKGEGYPSLNHAKGAITNHLKNAPVITTDAPLPVPEGQKQPQEMVDSIHASGKKLSTKKISFDETLAMLTAETANAHADWKAKNLPAVKASVSRNKREGHYFGKIAGVEHRGSPRKRTFPVSVGSMQNTRKQRKARKLDSRAHVRFLNNALFAALAA